MVRFVLVRKTWGLFKTHAHTTVRIKIVSLERGVSLVYPNGLKGGAVSCLTRPEAKKRIGKERERRSVDPERIRKHEEVWIDHFRDNMYKPSSRLIDNLIPKKKKVPKISLLKRLSLIEIPLLKTNQLCVALN